MEHSRWIRSLIILIAGIILLSNAQLILSLGGRSGASFLGSVSDNGSDMFFIFGGEGRGINTSNIGKLNDVWRWRIDSSWSWTGGREIINQNANYGTKGIEAGGNNPGARSGSISWSDAVGNFYLFGGQLSNGDLTNDLWRFNASSRMWTWLSGSSTPNALGVYGTEREYNSTSVPGARVGAVAFNITNGKLWMFGGKGNGRSDTNVYLNDLWNYDLALNQWSWYDGFDNGNQLGIYVGNRNPGARQYATSWTMQGKFWLFGGEGYQSSNAVGLSSELWSYDLSLGAWTNDMGLSLNSSIQFLINTPLPKPPNSRKGAVGWVDEANLKLYLFGGYGFSFFNGSQPGYLNDLVVFNMGHGDWTWISGSSLINTPGTYGTQGVPSLNNAPGSRQSAVSFADSNGQFYLFGGEKSNNNYLNDLWRYDPVSGNWTWLLGSNSVNAPGTYQVLTRLTPGGVSSAVARIDSASNVFILGGFEPVVGDIYVQAHATNQLWTYNTRTDRWTWLSKNKTNPQLGTYGLKTVPSVNNIPGSRTDYNAWIDSNNNYWVFGGNGWANTFEIPPNMADSNGIMNDLWRYNPSAKEWTWMTGNNSISYAFTGQSGGIYWFDDGVYGTKGVASVNNTPSARESAMSWQAGGKFWIFGGTTWFGLFTELWSFDPSTLAWTWVSGPKFSNAGPDFPIDTSVSGAIGEASVNFYPGSRMDGMTWTDANDDLWLFGGVGADSAGSGYLNDMWKFKISTNEWAWMGGSPNSTVTPVGQYGDRTVPAASNLPLPRSSAATWTSPGYFWMFGGTTSGTYDGYFNDLWRYNYATGVWTWMHGSTIITRDAPNGVFGTRGVPSNEAYPSARSDAMAWQEGDYLYLFGGTMAFQFFFDDMWRYQVSTNQWTWLGGIPSIVNGPANFFDACQLYPNGTLCEDYNECSSKSTCMSGACTATTSTSCSAPTCQTPLCYPPSGECYTINVPDTTNCDDTNKCTSGDTCQTGVCVGSPVICPGGQCLIGTCDSSTGLCPKADDFTLCDDGDMCTRNDTCQSGVCTAGDRICTSPMASDTPSFIPSTATTPTNSPAESGQQPNGPNSNHISHANYNQCALLSLSLVAAIVGW